MKTMHATKTSPAAKAAGVRRKQRTASMRGKTFEELSQSERDVLLKMVAVRLGFIEDSDDNA